MLLNWEKLMCDPGMHTLKTYQWQKLLLRKWPCPGRLMWWIWKRHPSWESQFCHLWETFTLEVGTIQKLPNRPRRLLSPLGSFFQCFFRCVPWVEAEALLLQCAPVVADLNSVKASVGMTMLAACQMAARDGVRVVLSGLGLGVTLIPPLKMSNKQGCKQSFFATDKSEPPNQEQSRVLQRDWWNTDELFGSCTCCFFLGL